MIRHIVFFSAKTPETIEAIRRGLSILTGIAAAKSGVSCGPTAGVAAASNYFSGASHDRSPSSVPSPRSCFTGSISTIDRLSPSVWKNDSSCFA